MVFSAAGLEAANNKIEGKIADVSEKLSQSYRKNRVINFKKAIAIADFENMSTAAKENSLGEAMAELFSAEFSQSTLFRVVERKNLGKIFQEQSLQLSGATDGGKAAEAGKLLDAQALLFGSVSEVGETFTITVKLTDVETGEILAETISVPKEDLIETREYLLDMAYVQKMGVGITLNVMGHTMCGNRIAGVPFGGEKKTGMTRNFGVEFRYRFTRNFMFGAGANWAYGNLKYFNSVTNIDPPGNTGPFRIEGQGMSIPINFYAGINPWRRLNLFAYAGPELFILSFSGYFIPSNGKGFGINEVGPQIHGETLGINAGAGAEFFITPRLAISLKLGYTYGKLEIDTASGNGHLNLPDKTEINLSGFTYMPAISFYF